MASQLSSNSAGKAWEQATSKVQSGPENFMRRRRAGGALCLATSALALTASPAQAQVTADAATADTLTAAEATATDSPPANEAPVDGAVVYTPADFARYAPRSALDMVLQIPDFTLEESSEDRGLGQASENVLINGQRVSGKSNDARSVLGSIAASDVQRIEVVDGASLNVPGLTGRVANVIAESGAFRFQYQWNAQFRRNVPDQLGNVTLSASGRVGASDVTLSFTNDAFRRGGVGPELITDANGTLLIRRDERSVFEADYPRLAGTLRRLWPDGTILNLNLSGGLYYFRARFNAAGTEFPALLRYDEQFRNREDEWNIEGGGDVEFDVGSGRLKFIFLQRYEDSPFVTRFTSLDRTAGAVATGSRFDRTVIDGETVLRSEYSWRGGGGDWQASIEGAYNFLDNQAALFRLQPDGSYLNAPIDGANVFVDEWRGEALLTRGMTLARGLNVQLTGGGEFSRIRSTGTNGLTRSFFRPKGTLRLTWAPDARWTVNAEFRRAVGQLSFFDFASRVDLENNNNSAGNRELVPDQSWRARLQATRSFGGLGSLTVGGYHEWITDIIDQVPITATTEGVGNLPRARRWAVTFSGTLNLDPLGAPGARLNFSGELRDSSVRDPLTGTPRRISEDLNRLINVEFRHDWPGTDFAWGAALYEERYRPVFRLDQVSSSWLSRPITSVFAEHKDIAGMTVRLGLRNILLARDDIRRDVYVTRRNGPLDFRERQIRNIYPIVTLNISGSF
jgi:hypothetical protein